MDKTKFKGTLYLKKDYNDLPTRHDIKSLVKEEKLLTSVARIEVN